MAIKNYKSITNGLRGKSTLDNTDITKKTREIVFYLSNMFNKFILNISFSAFAFEIITPL